MTARARPEDVAETEELREVREVGVRGPHAQLAPAATRRQHEVGERAEKRQLGARPGLDLDDDQTPGGQQPGRLGEGVRIPLRSEAHQGGIVAAAAVHA